MRLFADDCIIYRTVKTTTDCDALQDDLKKLADWEATWCMSFNASKCNAITISRKKNLVQYNYSLHNQVLERTDKATYLGVELTSKLTWSTHITKTCAKANRNLAFLRRNLRIKSQPIKEAAYRGIVRPVLEYCSPVWNPHHKKYIYMLEMVQRRAARYTLQRYHNTSSVSDMLHDLRWESLECRRTRTDVTMFFKIQHSLVAIPMPDIIQKMQRTHLNSQHHFQVPFCSTDSYKNSFFPRSVRQWNLLPSDIASSSSLPTFKAALARHKF